MRDWFLPRLRLVGEAWLKAFADLSGTRTQIVLMMFTLFALAFLKGLRLASTTAEVAALLAAVNNLFYAILVAWFGGKILDGKAGSLWNSLAGRLPGGGDSRDEVPTEEPWRTRSP